MTGDKSVDVVMSKTIDAVSSGHRSSTPKPALDKSALTVSALLIANYANSAKSFSESVLGENSEHSVRSAYGVSLFIGLLGNQVVA